MYDFKSTKSSKRNPWGLAQVFNISFNNLQILGGTWNYNTDLMMMNIYKTYILQIIVLRNEVWTLNNYSNGSHISKIVRTYKFIKWKLTIHPNMHNKKISALSN